MKLDPAVYQELLLTFRDELIENHKNLVDTLLLMEANDASNMSEYINTVFRIAHNLKGAARSVSLDKLGTLAHELEDKFSEWRNAEKYKPSQAEIDDSLQRADELLTVFHDTNSENQSAHEILKISLDKIERANSKADEFISHRIHLESVGKTLEQLSATMIHLQGAPDKEIINQLNALSENVTGFSNDFTQSLSAMQNELRSMRLVSMSGLTTSLKRTARDLSSSMGKKIRVDVQGSDTEIDKTILDYIKDPLQHLLRNAIDHGIESPDERIAKNKSAEGHLNIRLQQEAGKIKLLFSDDGRGIDTDKIKALALKNGDITQEAFKSMTHQDALLLTLLPGLSTASSVTEVSGRGVGLDVVKSNLEKIKGSLKIDSTLNQGTTFTITLPLTLATTRGVLISVAGHRMMFPTLSLESLHDVTVSALKSVENEQIFVIDDIPIPVKYLHDLLSLGKPKDSQLLEGIYMASGEQRYIVLVDAIEDEHDCVIKSLPKPYDRLQLYIGATLTGSDELVPVMNPKAIIELARTTLSDEPSQVKAKSKKTKAQKILVVDDSLTTRSLSVNALRAAGFEVFSAGDGEEAWKLLQKEKFDCVITDIEMPKKNGFELTTLIKANPAMSALPVIMVTAMESDAQKKQGLDCGADFYLVKSQFNTRVLIDAIKSVL